MHSNFYILFYGARRGDGTHLIYVSNMKTGKHLSYVQPWSKGLKVAAFRNLHIIVEIKYTSFEIHQRFMGLSGDVKSHKKQPQLLRKL